MTQPEALRLAQVAPYLEGGERGQWIMSAAAELRRLHESNTDLLAALKAAKTIIGRPDDAHTRMIADVINKEGEAK